MSSSIKKPQIVLKGKLLHKGISQESLGVQLYQSLKQNHGKEVPAIYNVATNEELSYKEILVLTCKLGEWMRQQNLRQDDVIMICAENIKEYFIPVIAAFYSCIVVANASPSYSQSEFEHAINLVQPKMLFCTKSCMDKVYKLPTSMKIPKIVDISRLDDLVQDVRIDPWQFTPINCNVFEQTAVIIFSSGTTGLFKAVMLTHRNYNARLNQANDPRIAATHKENVLLFLPFYHSFGFVYLLTYFVNGMCVRFMPRFELNLFLKSIETYKISMLPLVPPILVVLAKHPDVKKYDLSSVTSVLCGAAPLGADIEAANTKLFPNAIIRQGYGLTEVTFAATLFYNDVSLKKPGSCGTLIPGIQVIVRDPENGETLDPYEVGEFCVKSETVMKGYFRNEEATRASFTDDGWLRTGDMCYYDDDHYFYIVDRLKELIKYKAMQIAPAELEALLLTHPKVLDAAVIGKPDEMAGEVPMAFVVKKGEVDEQEILDFVAERVSGYKKLRGGVRFVKVIPKSLSGKILRRELRELVKNKSHL